MGYRIFSREYFDLCDRLRALERIKVDAYHRTGTVPDSLYGAFSGVKWADRRAAVAYMRKGLGACGSMFIGAVFVISSIVTGAAGLSTAFPLCIVGVAALAYGIPAWIAGTAPFSSLTQIKRVMYGYPSKESVARREADEAAWRERRKAASDR